MYLVFNVCKFSKRVGEQSSREVEWEVIGSDMTGRKLARKVGEELSRRGRLEL